MFKGFKFGWKWSYWYWGLDIDEDDEELFDSVEEFFGEFDDDLEDEDVLVNVVGCWVWKVVVKLMNYVELDESEELEEEEEEKDNNVKDEDEDDDFEELWCL